MALYEKKSIAIRMRHEGASYTHIKAEVGVSKSTLSLWLREYPLSEKRIRELRDFSAQRIERCRETKARKRTERLRKVYENVSEDIGILSDREIFLCGLFLYWGEGAKTTEYAISISNTDPGVLLFFVRWLHVLGVPKERLKVRIHIYADMNATEELTYWSALLDMPLRAFRKPYVKNSNRCGLTYKQRFTHGTCNVIYDNRDISSYVHAAMERLQNLSVAAAR